MITTAIFAEVEKKEKKIKNKKNKKKINKKYNTKIKKWNQIPVIPKSSMLKGSSLTFIDGWIVENRMNYNSAGRN